MSTFDIVTVNWNQGQTNLWRRHVEKHCPEANIILVGESDLKDLCWSCPKIGCLMAEFKHPDRVIYMDTDTIVFADLEELFDIMPKGRHIGVTRYSTFPGCHKSNERVFPRKGIREHDFNKLVDHFDLGEEAHLYKHYSSGVMVFRDFDSRCLAEDWVAASRLFREMAVYKKHTLFEEISLSWLLSGHYRELVWELPIWVHTNILGFHKEMIPNWAFILHYHTIRRLQKIGRMDLVSDKDTEAVGEYHHGDEDETPEQYKAKMKRLMESGRTGRKKRA